MTVDPDDILIFKMRGIKTAQKKRVEKAETVQAPKPQPMPQPAIQKPAVPKLEEAKPERKPFFAPKPAQPQPKPVPQVVAKPLEEKPRETPQRKPIFVQQPKPVPQPAEKPKLTKPVEAKERKPLFAFKPKPTQAPAPKKVIKAPQAAVAMEEMAQQATYSQEDEQRMRELANLEQMAALYESPPGGLEAEEMEAKGTLQGKEVKNVFATIAGLLFVADAIVFGYFIFPQSAFVINYAVANGLSTLALSGNYTYGISFVNMVLALLLAVSGISMVVHAKLSHLVSGATGSIILLSVTFEYLNSNQVYLLLVSVFTFVSVAALAYARMSAVVEVEQEAPAATTTMQDIDWPRLETF